MLSQRSPKQFFFIIFSFLLLKLISIDLSLSWLILYSAFSNLMLSPSSQFFISVIVLFFLLVLWGFAAVVFICLFLAALGLHSCTQAFSSYSERVGSTLHCGAHTLIVSFSLQRLLSLGSTNSRHASFSRCSTWAQ